MLKRIKLLLAMFTVIMSMVGCKLDTTESTQQFTITYDANGHGTTPDSKKVDSGYELTENDLPVLNESGFEFKGWKLGEDFVSAGYKVTEDITLKAVWEEIQTYTVTFDANGHGTAPEAITGKHKGEKIILPAALEADGYTFVNWTDGTNTYPAGATYTVTGNATITANWKGWNTVLTPTFSIAASEVDYGDKVTIECATEGADIYYTTDGTVPTTSSTKYTAPITITAASTIKAIAIKAGMNNSAVAEKSYTIKTYTVTFDADGHGTAPETITGKHKGETVTLPAALTTTGFTFNKWNDGTADYDAGATYTVNGNVTVKAKWIEWNTVAAPTFSKPAGEVDYDNKVTIACATPDADIYYTTDGTAPTVNSTKYANEEIQITAATTIKAIAVKSGMNDSSVTSAAYTIKLYTVTFDANGHGTAPDAMEGYKGQTITLPAALTEAGWLFEKWNDGTKDYNAGVSYTVNGNITFTAKWKDVAPAEVTNLTAKCTASQTVKLAWTNPTDTDFAKVVITYEPGNGNVTVAKTDSPNNEATVAGLTNDTEYTFTVKAYDNSANASSGVNKKCTPFLGTVYKATGNGGLEGYTNQIQGETVKETWVTDSGYLKINGTEIPKTSEVIAVPTGTVAKINMTSSDAKGDLFTSSRKVKLSPFVMSKYPVTRGLFKAVMDDYYDNIKDNQATPTGTEDKNPINYVNWFDAIVFCNKLSMKCGLAPVYSYDFGNGKMTNPDDWFKDTTNLSATVPTGSSSTNYSNWKDKVVINLKANGYRLPTEAEWEFCARGGDPNAEDWGYTYSGSNTVTDVAWYKDNSNDSGTNIVGYMNKKNKLGLYDMSGNVFEWCDDFFSSSATVNDSKYTDSEGYVKDPIVVSVSSFRGRRGGSWYLNANYCGVGFRDSGNPYFRNNLYGFRLVRSTETN